MCLFIAHVSKAGYLILHEISSLCRVQGESCLPTNEHNPVKDRPRYNRNTGKLLESHA